MEENTLTNSQEAPINNGAENTLKTIAGIILTFGIIATLICAVTLVFVENPEYRYSSSKIFSAAGFATTIEVFAGTLITWATLRVFANISITLKEINRKIK